MKQYPAYKDSKVEWLGVIPNEWSVKSLKYIASSIIGLTYSPSDISEESNGTLVLRASNINGGKLVFEDVVYVNSEISKKLITKEGDILVCSRSGSRKLIGKNAIIPRNAAGCTFGVFMTIIRGQYNYFLHYVFNSALFDYQAGTFLTSTINQLTQSNFNSFKIPFPPENDQNRIVAFLDHKTHLIDTLIDKKQKKIELLQEQRAAIINQAVTKGVNPNVKMKESGIAWLGEVPEHWNITTLDKLVDPFRKITYGIVQPGQPDPNGRYMVRGQDYSRGWANQKDIFRVAESIEIPYKRARLKEQDIVMTIVGAGVGNIAIVPDWLDGANITQTTARIAPSKDKADSIFIAYMLQSKIGKINIEMTVKGAAQPGLNLGHVAKYQIVNPPLNEQKAIAAYLNEQERKFQICIKNLETQTAYLQEYRTTLISDVVTGKIDVRDEAIPA